MESVRQHSVLAQWPKTPLEFSTAFPPQRECHWRLQPSAPSMSRVYIYGEGLLPNLPAHAAQDYDAICDQ